MKNIDLVNYLDTVCNKSGAYEYEITTESRGGDIIHFVGCGAIICQGLEAQKLFESMKNLSAMFCKMYVKNIAENLPDHELPDGTLTGSYYKEQFVLNNIESFI